MNTRMTVLKLRDGSLFVYAPVAPTRECLRLVRELDAPVKYIVLPTSAVEHKASRRGTELPALPRPSPTTKRRLRRCSSARSRGSSPMPRRAPARCGAPLATQAEACRRRRCTPRQASGPGR